MWELGRIGARDSWLEVRPYEFGEIHKSWTSLFGFTLPGYSEILLSSLPSLQACPGFGVQPGGIA